MGVFDEFKTATWWEILLKIVSIIAIGGVLGGVIIGTPLGLIFGPTYTVGITSGVLGIVGYLIAIIWNTNRKK